MLRYTHIGSLVCHFPRNRVFRDWLQHQYQNFILFQRMLIPLLRVWKFNLKRRRELQQQVAIK